MSHRDQTNILRITWQGRAFRCALVWFVCLVFAGPLRVSAYSSANYRIDDYVIDSGGAFDLRGGCVKNFGSPWSCGYFDSAFGEARGEVNTSASYILLDGQLYYDDDPPLFPPLGSADPNFMYWVQNVTPNSATFHIHTMDAIVPDPASFELRSGLNLTSIYYKASPDGSPGSWGYSDAANAWFMLGDTMAFADWKPVEQIRSTLAGCFGLVSCVTETGLTPLDDMSYAVAARPEVIRVSLNFSGHPFDAGTPGDEEKKTRVSPDSVVIFKAVDNAGNVVFSAEISSTPWLKTMNGDVHSNRKVIMFNTPPADNVAYMVSAADSIVNMTSERDWVIPNYPAYLEKLDWPPLDYAILVSRAQGGGAVDDGHGDGGVIADGVSDLDYFLDSANNRFDDQTVYYKDGNLTIGNGGGYEGVASNGAATIVVDGDLSINGNFVLNGGGYMAFLVRGNININGNVSEIRGTYTADFIPETTNGGLINTGDDSASPIQLVIAGQLIARSGFIFNRIFTGSFDGGSFVNEPSELVIYDPQVIINTPPGIKEFPSLGAWQEVRPK
ncbi:hypothetical protein AUK40_05820 [Candidatus Wirthbacteria bacterium CG2_30_54_11]|uniref:DUF7305 domain-containing protein n=1 Tax=Candidatus Wirthbacteria bacterium CG2_30_54_11 TaxID=1817892 RepID=A0A1J5IF35_9BACT|nr:MAG: hypothetical protein AUK40_05820 [Candidatus Wirthbacteria bacterium CG2_30_54_11]